MDVNRTDAGSMVWQWILCLPLLMFLLPVPLYIAWQKVLPSVVVYYAKDGKGDIHYVWNVQHRIYRGDLSPGHATMDRGFLFPDSDFFMVLDWKKDGGRSHCAEFNPTWPSTDIYLDADGNIDTREGSGTHKEGWKRCSRGYAEP